MIANKWYCIAQTGTFDSGCTINVSFDSYVIQFSASVKYGSSAINITRCELPLSANLSLRLRESNGLWSVDLLSNNDITPEIVVADSPYWVAINSIAGAGNIILTLKDISKDFNTGTGGSGGGLDENELRAFLDKYGYTQARDFWKYETTGGGAIHTDYHIIVDGGGAFGGAELGGGGESGGGGISEFYIQLGEGGQKYKLGNTGLPNVVQIPKYPVVPTNVSEFYNDAGYIGGEQAALIFSRISEVEARVEKLEKLWWVDENGNLHTTYNIVVEGGGAFGTGASVDAGNSGGLGRVILVNDSGSEYASDENGIVRIPDYVNKTWFDAQNFASQSWVLSKGYVSASALVPIREDITTLKKDVADLKGMWTIKDGKLHTTYSIVVEGGGAFGTGSASGGGGTSGGLGSVTIKTEGGIEYKSNSNGVVTVPNWITASALNGYATESYVTTRGYITGITSAMVTTALGYTPYNSANFTKATIKSTLGIADWALAASKPSYSWSEITGKPSFATVATSGKYSDLSGVPTSLPASDVADWAKKATLAVSDVPDLSSKYAAIGLAGSSSYVAFKNGGYIAYSGGDKWSVTNSDWTAAYGILHEGNYADMTDKRYLRLSGGTIQSASFSPLTVDRDSDSGASAIGFTRKKATLGFIGFNDTSGPKWFNTSFTEYTLIHSGNIGSYNAGSATKLQTARTIWGQSFDGTADVSGILRLYDSNGYHANILGNTTGITLDTWRDDVGYFPIKLAPNGGNILIGTTTDNSTKLQVAGEISTFIDGYSALSLQDSTKTGWSISYRQPEDSSLILYRKSNNSYSAKVKITSAGNILINTTADNGDRFQINGTINGTNYKLYNGTLNPRLELTDGTTTMYAQLYNSQMGIGPGSGKGIYITSGGNVLIGTNADSGNGAKLQVSGNLTVTGGGAFGSDARYKDILNYTNIDLATIADAPLFTYRWNDREDKKVYLGTSAQYWMDTAFTNAVNTDNPNFYHLDYGTLGVGIGIVVAREVKGVKTDIKGVKTEVEQLRDEVKQLKEKLNKYEQIWHN